MEGRGRARRTGSLVNTNGIAAADPLVHESNLWDAHRARRAGSADLLSLPLAQKLPRPQTKLSRWTLGEHRSGRPRRAARDVREELKRRRAESVSLCISSHGKLAKSGLRERGRVSRG